MIDVLFAGSSKFRITQDGELFTTDRLTKGSEYTVKVQVVDDNIYGQTEDPLSSSNLYMRHQYQRMYRVLSRFSLSIRSYLISLKTFSCNII